MATEKTNVKTKITNIAGRICTTAKHLLALFLRLNWLGRTVLVGVFVIIAGGITLVTIMPQSKTTATQVAKLPTPTITQTQTEQPTPTLVPTTEPEPTIDPVLEKGDEGVFVQALQEILMHLGYMELDESTQLYGPATKYAVKLFQRQHGLQQDGIAGEETQNAIYSKDAHKYTLLEGTSGTDVDSMQRQLVSLGYLSSVTGYYGTETVASVKEFQERNELSIDGKTGEHTLDLLYSPNALPSANMIVQKKRSANINKMLSVAEAQLGEPYIGGHEGPNSFDCSGLVCYCLKQAGSSRRRYNAAGYAKVNDWEKIATYDDLQKGDLLFFWSSSKGKIGHVGIYIGNGMMIDASSSNGKVVKRSCTSPYWIRTFKWARRPW